MDKDRIMPSGVYPRSPEQKKKLVELGSSSESRARISVAMRGNKNALGHKHSTESRVRMSIAMRGNKNSRGSFPCQVGCICKKHDMSKALAAARQHPSRPQLALQRFLESAGFKVVSEASFGPYLVDCYLPEYHLAFEYDGSYWHGLPGRREVDARRDAWLLKDFNLPVVHLSEVPC